MHGVSQAKRHHIIVRSIDGRVMSELFYSFCRPLSPRYSREIVAQAIMVIVTLVCVDLRRHDMTVRPSRVLFSVGIELSLCRRYFTVVHVARELTMIHRASANYTSDWHVRSCHFSFCLRFYSFFFVNHAIYRCCPVLCRASEVSWCRTVFIEGV